MQINNIRGAATVAAYLGNCTGRLKTQLVRALCGRIYAKPSTLPPFIHRNWWRCTRMRLRTHCSAANGGQTMCMMMMKMMTMARTLGCTPLRCSRGSGAVSVCGCVSAAHSRGHPPSDPSAVQMGAPPIIRDLNEDIAAFAFAVTAPGHHHH